MFDTSHYGALKVEQDGQVLTVRLVAPEAMVEGEIHWELGELFSRLRGEMDVRVVVITGDPADEFMTPPAFLADFQYDPDSGISFNDRAAQFRVMTSITRFHESVGQLEKPVIAKVNGDAIGLGASILFSCDLAVAVDDAVIADTHMLNRGGGSPWTLPIVPGDGCGALVPSHLSPMRAKEFLMLARHYTGQELSDLGVINRAVPREELDRAVDGLVQELLAKPAYALAWTKRIASRHVRRDIDTGLDTASAYEVLNFYEGEANRYVTEEQL